MPRLDSKKISSLIDAVDNMIDDARILQDAGSEEDDARLRTRYFEWYASAQTLVPVEEVERFKNMFEGGPFIKRIRVFLNDPRLESPLKQPSDAGGPGVFGIPKFAHPVEKTFVESIRQQHEILVLAKSAQLDNQQRDEVDYLAQHLANLGSVIRSLGSRYNQREPYLIEDEYDLQDLLTGVLRLFDEDTEPEDFAPKMGGTGSRLDWIMRTLEIAVEAKFCRRRDSKRKVRDELLADLATFEHHQRAKAFVALVYDPEHTIDNPVGFVRDLEDHGNKLMPTRILIIPKR